MIENYLLEELVTFAQCGTLSKTAERLMITQPTITRGLQKLETEFGVPLFNRQPNRITLNKAGKMAAEGAAKLLEENQKLIDQVQNYAQSQRVIKIGGTAPGPLIVANQLSLDHLDVDADGHFVSEDDIPDLLHDHHYTLILSHREFQTDELESLFVAKEHLDVNLDQFTMIANQQSVTFQELHDMSFIVLNDIGPWKKVIHDHIPNAKFLYQAEVTALQEITRYSNFPFFSTNVTEIYEDRKANGDRKRIPIKDDAATMDFYAVYLKQDRSLVRPIIKAFTKLWPELPKTK